MNYRRDPLEPHYENQLGNSTGAALQDLNEYEIHGLIDHRDPEAASVCSGVASQVESEKYKIQQIFNACIPFGKAYYFPLPGFTEENGYNYLKVEYERVGIQYSVVQKQNPFPDRNPIFHNAIFM